MIALIKKRLEVKIILSLICLLGAIIGVFTVIDIRMMRADTVRASEQSLASLARTVKGSVTADMKKGYHEDVQRIINEARDSFGIDHIIIYNEQGTVLRKAGMRQKEDKNVQRVPQAVDRTIPLKEQTVIHVQNGVYSLSYYSPIANQPECFRCHRKQNKLNGILRIDFSLQWVEALVVARRNNILIWTAVMIAALTIALFTLLRILVYRPIAELRDAMALAESGNESPTLVIKKNDEISELKKGFVTMLNRINELHRGNLEKEKELAHNQEIMRFRAELQTMFDAMPDGVLLIDRDMHIVQGNPRAYELLPGLKAVGGHIQHERLEEDFCLHHGIQSAFKEGKVFDRQCSIKLPDGQIKDVHSICAPIFDEGRVVYIVEVIRDMTERVKTERELEEMTAELIAANKSLSKIAITDNLTQVYNRRLFDEVLLKEIKGYTRRKDSSLSLLMIDIDQFKLLNDTYGHLAGDAVLRELANLLKDAVRETDTVARYGGEEFVIILSDTTLEGAAFKAEELRRKTEAKEFPGHVKPLHVTISIGVASYASGSTNDLISAADQALYQAKNSGRNAVVVSRAGEKTS